MKTRIERTLATALLLVAASTSWSQEPTQPDKPEAPQSAPPSLHFVGPVDRDGNLVVVRMETKTVQKEVTYTYLEDGKPREGVRKELFPVVAYVPRSVPLAAVRVFDARGKQLDEETIRKAITADTLVLTSIWGEQVDPAYLQIVKDDTLVVQQDPGMSPQAAPSPAPQQAPPPATEPPTEAVASPEPTAPGPAPAAPDPGAPGNAAAVEPRESKYPQSLPPSIVWTGGLDEQGVLTLMKPVYETHYEDRTETVKDADGKERQVMKKVTKVVSKLVPETNVLEEPVVFAVKGGKHGDQLPTAEARKRLERAQPVLIAFNGTPDDRCLSIFKDGTPIVLLAPQPVAPPAAPVEVEAQAAPEVVAPAAAPADPVAQPAEPAPSKSETVESNEPETPAAKPVQETSQPDERQVQKYRDIAESHYNRGHHNEAIKALGNAIEHNPNDPVLYYVLAYMQHRAGLVNEAEETVKTAAELEMKQSIASWGKSMERYQGTSRYWLETARK